MTNTVNHDIMKKNGNGELIAMKRNAVKIFALILIVCVFAGSIFTVSFSGYDDMEQVQVWRRIDIVLQSAKEYNNPYIDVDIDATFTHGDGTSIHLYGFWNGENEWRVRFSPTKTGVWDYVITCTDTSNNSLHNVKGKILATENTNETDIDKHGFIKRSDIGRYFVYDDGTPFYWLGDTNWQAPNYVSITKCNYPGCDCGNQFRHEVNDRLSKGFTVYQTYFDSSESDGGGQRSVSKEPSMWKSKYKKINPQSFTDKYDKMFDYLADNGVAIALGFGVHNSTTSAMKKDELDRLSRYLTARYAAYPVVWITAQEITGETHFDAWLSSARVTDEGDGYNHPQTAHQYPLDVNNEFVKALGKESWHDFYALQHGSFFFERNLHVGRGLDNLLFVADIRNFQLGTRSYFQREAAIEVGYCSLNSLTTYDNNAGTNDWFTLTVDNRTTDGSLLLFGCVSSL